MQEQLGLYSTVETAGCLSGLADGILVEDLRGGWLRFDIRGGQRVGLLCFSEERGSEEGIKVGGCG